MTLRYAVANGNWSALATLDGGASLPAAGDDVYANGKTVTIDQNVTVLSLRTTAGAPAVDGGGFTVATSGRTITADIYAGSSTCVTISANSATCTINGVINGSATTNNVNAVRITGTPLALTVNGNINGPTGASGNQANAIASAVASTTANITGNITAGVGFGVVLTGGSGSATVNGNLVASSACNALIVEGAGSVCSVTGGLNAGLTSGVTFALRMNLGTVGNCTVSGGAMGLNPVSYSGSRTCALTPTNTSSCGPGFAMGGSGVMTGVGNITANGNTGLAMSGTGVLNWIGNITGATTTGNSQGITLSASGTVNLTGNVYAGSMPNSVGALNTSGAGVINITGDVFGGTGATSTYPCWGALTTTTGAINIYGAACGTPTPSATYYYPGASALASGTLFVQVAKSNDYPNSSIVGGAAGVGLAGAIYCTVDSMETGSGGYTPILGRAFVRDAGANFVKMRQSNIGAITVMGEVANDYPAQANVRLGVSYDFGAKTGTCAVPPAGSVALGVPVDAATGTAVLGGGGGGITAADVWAYEARTLTDKAGFAPAAADNASAVRAELATELSRIDQPVSAAKTLTAAYDAAKSAATSAELGAAVGYILANLPAGITPADVWTHDTRSLTQDVGLNPSLTARLENCATVQSTGDQLAAMGV